MNSKAAGNIISELLTEKFLTTDSSLYYTASPIRDQNTLQKTGTYYSVSGHAKLKLNLDYKGYIYSFYNYREAHLGLQIHMGLFQDDSLINSVAVGTYVPEIKNEPKYAVLASIDKQGHILQYRVVVTKYEQPNPGDYIGNDKYYFTFGDTLETSQLIIKPDGSISGKNLVVIHD